MFGASITPEQKAHVEWSHSKMPNDNWAMWSTKNHKDNPEQFNPEVKQKMEYFAGSRHIPQVAAVRFDKSHNIEGGLKKTAGR